MIASGLKRYEYRRRGFSRSVGTIVVYATIPIGKAVGEFEVKRILSLSPEELWSVTGNHGGIDKAFFREYFRGKEVGFAIEVGHYKGYRRPYSIQTRHGVKPPQSFLYLDRKK